MSIVIDKKYACFDGDTNHIHLDFRPHFDLNLIIGSWEEGMFIRRGTFNGQIGIGHTNSQPAYAKPRSIRRIQNLKFTKGVGTDNEISWNDPEISLVGTHMQQSLDHPVRQFLETMPPDHLSLAVKFGLHQLTILRLLRYFPRSRDLLENDPIIYWMVAQKIAKSGISPKAAGDVLNQKRIQILDLVTNGISSRAFLKFTKKIQMVHFDRREMELLWVAIKSPEILNKFRHFPTVSTQIFRMSIRNPEMLDCKFFLNSYVYTNKKIQITIQEMTGLWRDTLRLGQQLEILNHQRIVAACPTLARLRTLHNKWIAKFNKDTDDQKVLEFIRKYGTEQFPPPPIPGIKNIVPICTVQELFDEGRAMSHCVGSYAEQVFSGSSFFYRVIDPERGTLEVMINNGIPNIKAFSLSANQTPEKESWKTVRKWLVNHQFDEKLDRNQFIPKPPHIRDTGALNSGVYVSERDIGQALPIQFADELALEAHVSVFGVGGKGIEITNYMSQTNMAGVKFHDVDVDQNKNIDLEKIVQGLDMVVIVGDISGVNIAIALSITQAVRKFGILAIAVIISPFDWEQRPCFDIAENSKVELCQAVNSVISLSSQQVISALPNVSFPDIREQINRLVYLTIRSFTDLIFENKNWQDWSGDSL